MNMLDIARENRDWQMRLLANLADRADEVGRDEVAVRLDITREELDEHLVGRTDVTFTELRLLAIACGVVIRYILSPDSKTISPELRTNLGTALILGQRIARAHATAQEVAADVDLAHLNVAELHAETLRRLETADNALATSARNGDD